MRRIICYFFISFFLVILQISFLNNLPPPWSYLNLLLGFLLFLAIISQRSFYWWAIFIGLFLDLFSPLPFGFHLLTFCLLGIILNFLFLNFFTNQSLYSLLALATIGFLLYHSASIFVTSFFYSAGVSNLTFNFHAAAFLNIFWQYLTNLLIIFIFFYFNQLLSLRFHSSRP